MRPVFLNPHRHRIASAIMFGVSIMLGSLTLLVLAIWRWLK